MSYTFQRLAPLLAATALFISGCDTIEDPIVPLTINYSGEMPAPEYLPMTSGPQHVLLEDFTAHQCGNCPPAGELATQLAEDNDGLVHVLAIHAGSLAAVSNAPFDTDWTNTASNFYWDQLDVQANPMGRVNRRGGSGAVVPPTNWTGTVAAELALNAPRPFAGCCNSRSYCGRKCTPARTRHVCRGHRWGRQTHLAHQRKQPHRRPIGLRQ